MGCKPRADQSDVKHTFGVTRRDLLQPQQPCEQANFTTKYPVADAYIRRLAVHIANANPKTLSGAFAPGRFCFSLNESEAFNAMASARFMLVELNAPILLYTASDAEVASVLAHELAHVVMRHDVAIHPDVEHLPEVAKLVAEAAGFEAEVQKHRAAGDLVADEKRAHLQALRSRLAASYPKFAAAVKRMDELNVEALALLKKAPFSLGVPNEPLPQSQMSPYDDDSLDAAGKARYAAMRDEFSKASSVARDVVWKNQTKAERDADWAFFHRSSKASKAGFDASAKASAAHEKIAAVTEKTLGRDVAANWTEAEADEVGYELYLRAGFVDEGFTWINRVVAQIEMNKLDKGLLTSDEVLAECLKERKNLNEGIVRGSASHPTSCWRLSDIRLKEDKDHEVEYAPLKAAAKTIDLPGTPTLDEARKEIEAAKPDDESGQKSQ